MTKNSHEGPKLTTEQVAEMKAGRPDTTADIEITGIRHAITSEPPPEEREHNRWVKMATSGIPLEVRNQVSDCPDEPVKPEAST